VLVESSKCNKKLIKKQPCSNAVAHTVIQYYCNMIIQASSANIVSVSHGLDEAPTDIYLFTKIPAVLKRRSQEDVVGMDNSFFACTATFGNSLFHSPEMKWVSTQWFGFHELVVI